MADVEIEINGQIVTAKANETILQAADAADIYIPRFCYHKHLSIAANCRMCLVEVEKSPKTVPACATPVAPGMKVFTRSQKTIEAQRAVMEFLLINHPLDCPICDQGGECELQDLAMGYGKSHSQYEECKRAVPDLDLGPLIATEMTRCIYCTRCVRFGDEIAGVREMGGTYRGENTEIGTFIKHAITSPVSGNIIDLCPVGALTSKPYRFTARPWELNQTPSISPHDCWGSNLNVHTLYGKVKRVVSRENDAINETWISDRDRYAYTALDHPDRLDQPLMKIDGQWREVEWQEALETAAQRLQEVIARHGADKLGALASPNSTLEEFYLLQKIIRDLDSPHVDHRLREQDTRDESAAGFFPGLNMPIAEIEECETIFLIGSNLSKEQPLAALRLRKAIKKGAHVLVLNPMDYSFNFDVQCKKMIAPHFMPDALAAIVKALGESLPEFENAAVDENAKVMAETLQQKKKTCILLGALAHHHSHASVIRSLAKKIAQRTGATLGLLTAGANTAGGWIAGAVSHRHAGGSSIHHVGLNAYDMLHKPRKAYVLLNIEPEYDFAHAHVAIEAIKQAELVIALSLYRNPILEKHADIIFPMAAFAETSGTYVNVSGEWQSFKGIAVPFGASRPAWKILRVLGNFLKLNGYTYESSEEIKQEVKASIKPVTENTMPSSFLKDFSLNGGYKLSRIGEIPIYAGDSLLRRAKPLQEAQKIMEGDLALARMHPETAAKLKLQDGAVVKFKQQHAVIELPLKLDAKVACDAVWIAGGIAATSGFGDLMGEIEVVD